MASAAGFGRDVLLRPREPGEVFSDKPAPGAAVSCGATAQSRATQVSSAVTLVACATRAGLIISLFARRCRCLRRDT